MRCVLNNPAESRARPGHTRAAHSTLTALHRRTQASPTPRRGSAPLCRSARLTDNATPQVRYSGWTARHSAASFTVGPLFVLSALTAVSSILGDHCLPSTKLDDPMIRRWVNSRD